MKPLALVPSKGSITWIKFQLTFVEGTGAKFLAKQHLYPNQMLALFRYPDINRCQLPEYSSGPADSSIHAVWLG